MKLLFVLVGAACIATALAHAQAPPAAVRPMPMQPAAGTPSMPLVNGEVKKIDKARGEVVLQHGDLPNLGMPAMTMAFSADQATLARLKLGDKVRFNAQIVAGKATVTHMVAAR